MATFAQVVPHNRPVFLVEPFDMRKTTILYQDVGTGEQWLVPSIWYNQPVEARISAEQFYAERYAAAALRNEADYARSKSLTDKWRAEDNRQCEKDARIRIAEMQRTGLVPGRHLNIVPKPE